MTSFVRTITTLAVFLLHIAFVVLGVVIVMFDVYDVAEAIDNAGPIDGDCFNVFRGLIWLARECLIIVLSANMSSLEHVYRERFAILVLLLVVVVLSVLIFASEDTGDELFDWCLIVLASAVAYFLVELHDGAASGVCRADGLFPEDLMLHGTLTRVERLVGASSAYSLDASEWHRRASMPSFMNVLSEQSVDAKQSLHALIMANVGLFHRFGGEGLPLPKWTAQTRGPCASALAVCFVGLYIMCVSLSVAGIVRAWYSVLLRPHYKVTVVYDGTGVNGPIARRTSVWGA
jgi:hypothetical protein